MRGALGPVLEIGKSNSSFTMIADPKHIRLMCRSMSALGHKQTSRRHEAMSALPPKADIDRHDEHVRLVPKADSCTAANAVHGGSDYSITSSASASNVGGRSSPSALAALRLITSSNLTACTTGRSEGFSPRRMRPA